MYLETEYVKTNFPLWEQFCLANDVPDDDTLTSQMTLADNKLDQYIYIATGETLPDWLKLHVLNIVRKYSFDLRHGDTEFAHKPSILKDYNDTIIALEELSNSSGKIGSGPIALSILTARITANASADKIKVSAKVKMFGPVDGVAGGFADYEEETN